jgi:hypothetical protein
VVVRTVRTESQPREWLVALVNRRQPVFVSYRWLDGADRTTDLAWLLRAAGVPVWQDISNLAPGNTERRLEEALDSGLSGAVLVVTPDMARSGIVRKVELPRLLALAEDLDFDFAILNGVQKDDGSVDFDAPDKVLGQSKQTLASITQYPGSTRGDLVAMVNKMLTRRAERFALAHRDEQVPPLHISVQSRDVAPDLQADLNVRLRPAQGRLPSARGLQDLRDVLPLLPAAVSRSGARELRVAGGAHLSVAFTLGLALPQTLIGRVRVEDSFGETWAGGTPGPRSASARLKVEARAHAAVKPTGEQRNVLAYVNLLPRMNDAAYTRLLDESSEAFDAWQTIRPSEQGDLNPGDAAGLVRDIADVLKSFVAENDSAHLHLLLACPYPVALLLGRLCNTLTVTLYEWDDTPTDGAADVRPRYRPVLTADASRFITNVALPDMEETA